MGKSIADQREYCYSKGQITVTLAIVLVVSVSLLLSVIEAARSKALEVRFECAVSNAMYSMFAEYHKELAEQYDLLFLDSSYQTNDPSFAAMETRFLFYMQNNCLAPEDQITFYLRDWYGVTKSSCSIEGVRLATDGTSPAVYQQAVDYMKTIVGADFCEEIQGWVKDVEEYDLDGEEIVKDNQKLIEQTRQERDGDSQWDITRIYPEMDIMALYKDHEVALFTGYGEKISDKSINLQNTYSLRKKKEGDPGMIPAPLSDPLQDIYFNEYILMKLGNYGNVREESALDYQTEYILYGLPGDEMNLGKTCDALFLLRLAANMIPLTQSKEAKDIVETISLVLMLLKLPQDITKPLLYMLWDALESILDMQKLLRGERVPLLKEYEDFSISLNGITEIGEGLSSVKTDGSIADGMSYEDYLRIFLLITPRTIRIERCVDMIEHNIRLTSGNAFFTMDGCVEAVTMQVALETAFGHFYSMNRKYGFGKL